MPHLHLTNIRCMLEMLERHLFRTKESVVRLGSLFVKSLAETNELTTTFGADYIVVCLTPWMALVHPSHVVAPTLLLCLKVGWGLPCVIGLACATVIHP